MKTKASEDQIHYVVKKIEEVGAKAHLSKGKYKTIIGAIGDREQIVKLPFKAYPGVEDVLPISKPYKLVSREFKPEDTIIDVGGVKIGGSYFAVMAGPCSIESEEQVMRSAEVVKKAGAQILRGGAYKPRTSPYSFQGLGEKGLKMMAKAREVTGMPIVTEVLDTRDVATVAKYADILQIGARNMQNFTLLTEVGKLKKPILLKKAFSCTIEETLMSAEYILKGGNTKVIICERGLRSFESATRNTLDISAIPIIKSLSHLPVIVDPSHATGKRDLIKPLGLAALAAGADGLMIEVHPAPEEALCDGPQSVTSTQFDDCMKSIISMAKYLGLKGIG